MFLCCEDFIAVGLHNHKHCCKDCHFNAFNSDKPRTFKPKVPYQYRNFTYHCCCGFVSKEYSESQMEEVIQYVVSTRHTNKEDHA